MTKINIDEMLLRKVKENYDSAPNDQEKFSKGMDYLEVMVKLFAIINISVVKHIDPKVHGKIFCKNFDIKPSLGHFKSLATVPFGRKNNNILKKKNNFYAILYDVFTSEILDLHLDMAVDIHEDNNKKTKITNLCRLFDDYVVNFRNNLQGHAASFNSKDEDLSLIIITNLDNILKTIESKLKTVLSYLEHSFFIEEDKNSEKEHNALKVFIIYDEIKYQLSPLIVYLECKVWACKNNHKVKLFFYNGKNASKSEYIDYGYNHFYSFSSNNNVENTLKEMNYLQDEINAYDTSDNLRQRNLLSVFVGREKELKSAQEHIIGNIDSYPSSPSAITVIGDPGIGKSSFISKLQEELNEKKKGLQTYIFYARKFGMTDDELQYFYNNFEGYLDDINISISKLKNNNQLSTKEKLEHVLETLNTELKDPLLLIIDGLDEFKYPVSFLENFPMHNIPNKLHIIFSTRINSTILETLKIKLFNSEFNILNQDKYQTESSSIKLENLSSDEVRILIDDVLPNDVKEDNKTYIKIQKEIYQKSVGLPLYIHYISNMLKESNLESSNIPHDILRYIKEFPQGLANFYVHSLKKLMTKFPEILYTLYFSHKNIGFDSFYQLQIGLKNENINREEFQNSYFNEIELFLTQDTENKYGFYHLSVKEAIKIYFMQENKSKAIIKIDYNVFKINTPVISYQEEQYRETFDTYYYLKKNSDLFDFLEGTYRYLSDKQNDNKLSEIYQDNYLTYFYKYIHFSNYHEMGVVSENTLQIDYTKFKTAVLSNKIIDLIQKFFKAYESSPKQDINEIKYAHEFALLTNDYDRVLSYSKDYEDAFFNLFIDMIWNLDKPKNQKLFKGLKPIWSDMYNDEFIFMLLHCQKLYKYSEYIIEVAYSINRDTYKSKILAFIAVKTNNKKLLDEALKILDSLNYSDKSEALLYIVENVHDVEYALEIVNTVKDTSSKSVALAFIASKMEDPVKTLEIAKSLDDIYKLDILKSIVDKTDDQNLLDMSLVLVKSVDDTRDKSKLLASIALKFVEREKAIEVLMLIEFNTLSLETIQSIVMKIDDEKVVEKAIEAKDSKGTYNVFLPKTLDYEKSMVGVCINVKRAGLDIINSITDDQLKSRVLGDIVDLTDDENTIKEALAITNPLESSFFKSSTLELIASKINDIEQALEIANSDDCWDKTRVLTSIVSKTDDQKLLDKVLKISNSIKSDKQKCKVLSSIVEKTDDRNILVEALKMANLLKINDVSKSKLLVYLAIKTHKQNLLDNVLESLNITENSKEKIDVLVYIVSKIDDQKLLEKALESISSIKNKEDKFKVLLPMLTKVDNKKLLIKTLENVSAIKNSQDKSKVLSVIVDKINDSNIALDIVSIIKYPQDKAKALKSIINKIDSQKLLEKALGIVNTIEVKEDQLRLDKPALYVSIVDKINDSNMALNSIKLIEKDANKSSVLSYIVLKKDGKNLLNKAFKITNSFNSNRDKSEVFVSIVEKTYDKSLLKKVLKIVTKIKDETNIGRIYSDIQIPKILASIGKKTDDQRLLEQSLEYIDLQCNDWDKLKVLVFVIEKIDDQKLLKKALTIIKSIEYDWYKKDILVSIVTKTYDRYLLDEVSKIGNSLKDNKDKVEVLAGIAVKIDNQKLIEKALKIAHLIPNNWEKSDALLSIVSKIDDFERALEIVHSIEGRWSEVEALTLIASKVDNIDKILEFIDLHRNDSFKDQVLVSVITKRYDIQFLEKVLKITSLVSDELFKIHIFKAIIEKTDNHNLLGEILKTVNTFKDNVGKLKILEISALIAVKTDDQNLLDNVLGKLALSGNSKKKEKVLISIASKTGNRKVLEETLISIASSSNIKNESKELLSVVPIHVIISIISRMGDIEKALKIVNSFEDETEREKAYIEIKKNNTSLSSLDNYLYKFNTALNFNISKSLEYVALYNEDTILRYYDILDIKNKQKKETGFILKMKNLFKI